MNDIKSLWVFGRFKGLKMDQHRDLSFQTKILSGRYSKKTILERAKKKINTHKKVRVIFIIII